jgi:hypothetical protein
MTTRQQIATREHDVLPGFLVGKQAATLSDRAALY